MTKLLKLLYSEGLPDLSSVLFYVYKCIEKMGDMLKFIENKVQISKGPSLSPSISETWDACLFHFYKHYATNQTPKKVIHCKWSGKHITSNENPKSQWEVPTSDFCLRMGCIDMGDYLCFI